MQKFESSTNLPKSYGIIGAFSFYLLLIFINVGGIGEILANIIGFVIPTYYSLVALKTKDTTDDTQLLTYWIVFAFLSVIEFWSKAILYWIPFYWFFKTIFLIYTVIPQLKGAQLVYEKIIAPLTDSYIQVIAEKEDEIAEALNSGDAGSAPL